jgi:anaerobic selenocysteine-containing dehydrogenase
VVAVSNELALVTVHAKVTDRVLPGTLWAPRPLTGLNGVPLNFLVPGVSQDIGGGPIFNSVKVKIEAAARLPESDESAGSAEIEEKQWVKKPNNV